MTGNLSSATALAPTPNTFDFESHAVRVVMRDDEPWFVAADVCAALEIANSRDALMKLDADEKGVGLTDTLGGRQQVAIVSESGMYALVLRCRDAMKPGTVPHRFRKWVTSIVLPAIRKTGQFTAQPCIDDAPAATRTPADLASLNPPTSSARCNCSTNTSTRQNATPACSSSCRTTKPKNPSSSPPAAIGTSAPAR